MSTENPTWKVLLADIENQKLERVKLQCGTDVVLTFITTEEMNKEELEKLLEIILGNVGMADILNKIKFIQIMIELGRLFTGFASQTKILLDHVCKSNFHDIAAKIITANILVPLSLFNIPELNLLHTTITFCVRISDDCTEFVRLMWSTNIIEQLLTHFKYPELSVMKRGDALVLLSNITTRSNTQQREILYCPDFINSLEMYRLECSQWEKLIVAFCLAMLVNDEKIHLLDDKGTLMYALKLMNDAWQNNLRRGESFSLLELLNGLYYLLRSNEMKMSFLNQENMNLLINIMTDCNDQEELVSSLAVLKQLIRDDAVKLKLVREFQMMDRLNHFLTETHFPNVKMVVNDIIDTLQRVQQ